MISKRNLFLSHIGQTTRQPLMIEVERAEGIWLFDPENKKYLDLVSGVSVSNTGHNNPVIREAVKKQVDSHMHLMVYGEMVQSSQVEYASNLIKSCRLPSKKCTM